MNRIMDTDQAYENLAHAIIKSAVNDYKSALIHARNHPNSESAWSAVERQEKFFFSHWYETLTDLDPTYLIRKVKEMVGIDERG